MTQVQMSKFAETIMRQKYSHELDNGEKENWENIAYRVSKHVLKAVRAGKPLTERIRRLIAERKFIPGGRYLACSGRLFHQVNNCFLFRAEDSREGWSDLMQKSVSSLMTGGGVGTDYSLVRPEGKLIRKTGGRAAGALALMQMVNEGGRYTRQYGDRRAAIWAGLNWAHGEIQKFITLKNWAPEVRALKAQDYNFPAAMDGTNISVLLDDEFFEAFRDEDHSKHSLATNVYWSAVRQMLKTGEPGFSIDLGKNSKETLRNAPVCGETHVLTDSGYLPVCELVGTPVTVWTGKQWATDVVFKETSSSSSILRVTMTGGREIRCDKSHPFFVKRYGGFFKLPANTLEPGDILHVSLPQSIVCTELRDVDGYALGYIYGDGSFGSGGRNAEITFCTDESKKSARIIQEASRISSINWNDGRGYVRAYFKSDDFWVGRDKAVFPTELYSASIEYISAFLAGLFDADGNWEQTQKRIRLASKHEGFLRSVSRLLEQCGILSGVSKAGHSTYGQAQTYQLVVMSEYNRKFTEFVPCVRLQICLDGYTPYRPSVIKVLSVESDGLDSVYCANVKVSEHSFQAEGVIIANCTEITSADDGDVCNLASINLARIDTLAEMAEVVELAMAFQLAGTVYSDVPFAKVDQIRSKNRRLGLGLMGLHEWLLLHGKKYGPDSELEEYLKIYAQSGLKAKPYADKWDLSHPVKTRAIAPVGTIGIIGETTTGIEPIFCAAYKRRYLDGASWQYQFVVDPTAKRLRNLGVPLELIEDAYGLAEDVERRIAFQAWVQQYVDHSISSTINLPRWGSRLNNDSTVQAFGRVLMKYLPQLRGITFYPDGARDGQPLTAIPLVDALNHEGEIHEESGNVCETSRGGECGA